MRILFGHPLFLLFCRSSSSGLPFACCPLGRCSWRREIPGNSAGHEFSELLSLLCHTHVGRSICLNHFFFCVELQEWNMFYEFNSFDLRWPKDTLEALAVVVEL